MAKVLSISIAVILISVKHVVSFNAFSINTSRTTRDLFVTTTPSATLLHMAKQKSKKKGGSSASTGIKGFGGGGATSKDSKNSASIDRSKSALTFYSYLEQNGASATLKKTSLGQFPLPNSDVTIRGVMALKPIAKGEIILSIPYEMALNLGREGNDPTIPAVELLKNICDPKDRKEYIDMLPEFRGRDCSGSTDFFSEEGLDALQSPLIKEETVRRQQKVRERFMDSVDTQGWNMNQDPVTEEHLRWATWLITSRVLTVQSSSGVAYRLMIPFLDMCNHDRKSKHILSGLAEEGGTLKVIAGEDVEVGEQITISYEGGVAGNDRFIQDYGFLDWDESAYDMVAKKLSGRVAGGLLEEERRTELECLKKTTLEEDILERAGMKEDIQIAIDYRTGLKKALKRWDK